MKMEVYKQVNNLVKSGAFDKLNPNRFSTMCMLEFITGFYSHSSGDNYKFNFPGLNDTELKVKDFTETEKARLEREVTGLNIRAHPTEFLCEERDGIIRNRIKDIYELSENTSVTVAVIIIDKRTVKLKDNRKLIYLLLEDYTGYIEAVADQKVYGKFGQNMIWMRPLTVKGILQKIDREPRIKISKINLMYRNLKVPMKTMETSKAQ